MIDPLISLSFSLHSNPGAYALLIGSGASRSAGVPTGWEITLDLIRKLAFASGDDAGDNPAEWFTAKYDQDPDYSALLESLAKTEAERAALLRSYFEPSEEEKPQGLKVPLATHRSIARMVKMGLIKMILTTNFDRLLETALADEGIIPDLITNVDSLKGAPPYVHSRCTIIKLHGDYRDVRVRNTARELTTYPEGFDSLLDRIFDEFGLLVCGWSGEWDKALVSALLRCSSLRYTLYWLTLGELGNAAQMLVIQRRAQVIRIDSADKFFDDLLAKVQSLQEFDQPHPLSKVLLVQTLKRYLSDDVHRIKLMDLLENETNDLRKKLASPDFGHNERPDQESIRHRLKAYESASEQTVIALTTLAKYDDRELYVKNSLNVFQSLLILRPRQSGYSTWRQLEYYPGLLIVYSMGLVSLKAQKYRYLFEMLCSAHSEDYNGEKSPVINNISIISVFSELDDAMQPDPQSRKYTPSNNYVWQQLKQLLGAEFGSEKEFDRTFDVLECLIGMVFLDTFGSNGGWAPVGRMGWKHEFRFASRQGRDVIADLFAEHRDGLLSAGFFGGSKDRFDAMGKHYVEFLSKLNWH